MTGQDMLKIHNALKIALDAAGGSQLKTLIFLEKINEMGLDIVIMDKPQITDLTVTGIATTAGNGRLHLTSEEAA